MKLVNLSGPQDVIALLVRRKWWVILPFIALSAGVILITTMLPQMYVSESLILVRPRDVPNDLVKDLIAGTTAERLTSITERLLSDSNLQKILKLFKLPEFQSLNPYQQTTKLRNQIDVQFGAREHISQGQSAVSAFRITCQNRDPIMAQKIAKQLIEVFKEEDRKGRAANVNETATFFQSQVDGLAEKLSESDMRLKVLRSRRRNELPNQLESNLRRLEALTTENEGLRRERTNYVLTLQQLEQQMSEVPKEIPQPAQKKPQTLKDPTVDIYRVERAALKVLKAGMGYTDEHPSVKRQKATLQRLEVGMTPEQIALGKEDAPASTPTEEVETMQSNPLYIKMEGSREYFTAQIQYIDQKTAENDKAIEAFQRHVDNIPQGEVELADVLRENNDLSRQHQEMAAKLAAARLSESAENQQKGSQLEVVDAPSLPLTPTKPSKSAIVTAGLTLSLLIGIGLAFLVDIAHQKTWTQSDITQQLGVKVLAEVPRIATRDGVARAQKKKIGFVTSAGIAGIAYAFFLYVAYAHPGFVLQTLDPLIQKLY